MRSYGTCAYGVRAPIIRPGDDLVTIVADSVEAVAKEKKEELARLTKQVDSSIEKLKEIKDNYEELETKMDKKNGNRGVKR